MNNKTEFVFMSDGLFEYMTETEAYVFSFIAYFACDATKGRIFKRTTASLCKNLGYSSNTIRTAIESLIAKQFLVREDPPARQKKQLKYTYIEEVSHHLKIGTHEYGQQFSHWLSVMLNKLRDGTSKEFYSSHKADISFYKVYVSALQSRTANDKWKRNQSRHLHKALIVHGYLLNRNYWNQKHFRTSFSRSVAYMSAEFQWSQNTIRRIIHTLKALGYIKYYVENARIYFHKITRIVKIRRGYESLSTQITSLTTAAHKAIETTTSSTQPKRPGRNASPAEHARYLAQIKALQKA